MRFPLRLTGIVALMASASPVPAATTETPGAHELIQAVGQPFPGDRYLELRAVYEPYLREAGFPASKVTRDIAYGPHPLQKLDVLEPESAPAGAMPIVVFVHGGAFVRGDKGDDPIFDNVLNYFTRHGMLGVNVNYRLAPEFTWPAAANDLRDVMRWLRGNAGNYGGNPDRIFLLGHSAGAVHVATYALDESLQLDDDGLAGAMLMSGIYSDASRDASGHVYFGDDPQAVSRRVPLAHVAGRRVPLFVIDAELDPLLMQQEALKLIAAVCGRDGRCPRHQQVAGHNHYSMTYHINTLDDSIGHAMVDFVRQHSRPRP
ncbi:MAG: alpha/beta hydrolase [Woeseiaceae bacterium]|nr:alpha/beta hydrolase [Woeseiaceae bacterium]